MSKILNPAMVRPIDLKPGHVLGYKIVAVIGFNHDWAAYEGLIHWADEKVINNGDKISKEAAEALFYAPRVAGLTYRSR